MNQKSYTGLAAFKMKWMALILSTSFLYLNAFGQSIEISQDISMRSNTNYDLIGQFENDILMVEDNGRSIKLIQYDEKLALINSHEINFNQRRAIVRGYVPRDSQLTVYYTWQDSGNYKLNLSNYSYLGQKINDTTIYIYENKNANMFPAVVSEDKEEHLIKIPLGDRATVLLQVTPQTQTINWIQYYQPESEDFFSDRLLSHTLTNRGEYFMLLSLDRMRRQQSFKTIKVNQAGVYVKEISLSDVYTEDLKLITDNYSQSVYVLGIYASGIGSSQEGIFLNKIKINEFELDQPLYLSYLSKTVSDFHGKDETNRQGIYDFEVKEVFFRKDGGLIVLCEQTKEVSRYNSAGRNPFLPVNTSTDYYVEDVLLTSLSPTSELEWQKILKKKQQSYDDDAAFSSYFIHSNPSSMRVLFNDEIKFENTVSEYIINPLGKIERRVLLNTAGNNLHIQMRNGVQLDANTSLLPSVFKGKLRLIKLRY